MDRGVCLAVRYDYSISLTEHNGLLLIKEIALFSNVPSYGIRSNKALSIICSLGLFYSHSLLMISKGSHCPIHPGSFYLYQGDAHIVHVCFCTIVICLLFISLTQTRDTLWSVMLNIFPTCKTDSSLFLNRRQAVIYYSKPKLSDRRYCITQGMAVILAFHHLHNTGTQELTMLSHAVL